jgi:hypothetical protein
MEQQLYVVGRGNGHASNVYERLRIDREPFLQRARECARYTVPSVMPEEEGSLPGTKGQKMPEPWQSFGARAVNNIVSKLALALMPLNAKFFRLAVDEASLELLGQYKDSKVEVEKEIAQIEDMVLDKIEMSGVRTKVGEALRYTEVSGNALLHIPANRPPRTYRMDSYVVERDSRDHIMQLCIREHVTPMILQADVKARLAHLGVEGSSNEPIEVFTMTSRDSNGDGGFIFREWQEVNGKVFGKVTTHQEHRNPYIAVRGSSIDGESWGRSHCEEYLGDLRALDALSKALQQGSAQAAKVVWLIRPGSQLRIRKLAKAENGDMIPGNEGDATPLQMNKFNDFSIVRAEIQDLKRDLGMAFLMNSTVPRQAERVTAEEIRLVASELDDTLGQTFSLLSADLQLPLVNIILGNMQEAGEIEPLPDQVKPVIVTGLDAIGRGHDLQRLDTFIAGALQTFGPDVLQSINMNVYLQARAVALGIDTEQLIKSDEQLAQEQQAAQAQEAAMKLGPSLLKDAPPEAIAEVAQQFAGAPA